MNQKENLSETPETHCFMGLEAILVVLSSRWRPTWSHVAVKKTRRPPTTWADQRPSRVFPNAPWDCHRTADQLEWFEGSMGWHIFHTWSVWALVWKDCTKPSRHAGLRAHKEHRLMLATTRLFTLQMLTKHHKHHDLKRNWTTH